MTDRTPVRRDMLEDALEDLKDASYQRARALYAAPGEVPQGAYQEACAMERAQHVRVIRMLDEYVSARVDSALLQAFGMADFLQLRAQGLI